MSPRVEASHVKAAARGRWLSILPVVAPTLADAVALAPQHVACPTHLGRNGDGFRLFDDAAESGGGICNTCGAFPDGFSLLGWANGWTFPETLAAVASHLGMAPDEAGAPSRRLPPVPPISAPPKPDDGKRAALRRAWAESKPIQDCDPVAHYLEGRRLDLSGRWPECLKHHPGMLYHEEKQVFGPFPVMLARIDGPDGRPVGLHRTYLTTDGHKAPVVSVKKMMPSPTPGATRGSAVRLFPAEHALAVAEGIETALSVHLMAGLPAWATVSAGGMEAVRLPAEVREVIICGDHDATGRGQVAASKLAARLLEEGRKVRVAIPEKAGTDWADLWALEAEHGTGEVMP